MIFHVAGAFGLVRRRRATLEFVEQRAVRLAHHLREHVESAAMRHADAYFAHAEIAAALDDLLERRDQRFAAVETETLGAGIFDVDEFLEAFGFHQLVENGALALNGEADFLVAAFDALLDPAFLRGIGDVHELHAQRLAIGAAQDSDNLAHGRKFEPEHLVEENPAVEIGFGETVGARVEFFFVLFRLEPERIELGVEMAAHAVGADQHQRVDGIARRLLHLGRGNLDALALRQVTELAGYFLSHALFGFRPLPVERGHQVAVRTQRPIRFLPGGAARAVDDVGARVLQALEKLPPLGIDRGRVALEFGVEVFDVGGVAAVEERGAGEGGIGVLAGHGCSILARRKWRILLAHDLFRKPVPPTGQARGQAFRDHAPANGNGLRDRHPTADCCFNAIYDVCKSTKDLRTESRFQYFYQGVSRFGPARVIP